MQIPPENLRLDAIQRRLKADALARTPTVDRKTTEDRADAVDLGFSPESVQRFVDILRNMNPEDVHRVADLKKRIAEGTYTATPQDLADAFTGQSGR